jgi:hypothetical protein
MDDQKDLLNALSALEGTNNTGEKPRNPTSDSIESKSRKSNLLIVPGDQPVPPEDDTQLFHASQYVFAFNLAGTGEQHQTKHATNVAVRLLACARNNEELSAMFRVMNSTIMSFPTHSLMSLRLEGPGTNEQRVSELATKFVVYRELMTQEFAAHLAKGRSNLPAPQVDPAELAQAKEMAKQDDVRCEEKPVPLVGPLEDNKEEPEVRSQPFFVVTFVPEVLPDNELDYTEPLMSVMGGFTTEFEALVYGKDIAERVYPRLDFFVVQGGVWIHPVLLNSTSACAIKKYFPNVKQLEEMHNSPSLLYDSTKAQRSSLASGN